MSRYKTYRVCKYCFNQTKTSDHPILAETKKRGTCSSCGGEWMGIKVGYYHPDNKYYEVRRKLYYSENRLCHFSITDICDRGERCRYAHNRLELELWTEGDTINEEMIRCVICNVEFRKVYDLESHLQSRDHLSRTTSMKILPEVGSSQEYKGPIRERPKVPGSKDTYGLCQNFMKHGRCDYLFGCKHAHSEEELKVWIQAQIAEEESRKTRRWQSSSVYKSQSSSSYASGNANPGASYSSSRSKTFSSSSQNQDESEEIEGESEYYWRVQGEIGFLKIEDVVKNMPDHIEILCNNHLEQTMEESSKEFRWVFRIKSSKQELVHGIMLYDDRNMFNLGGVHKGVEGGKYSEIKFSYIPNRICYQLQKEINSTTFIDVTLTFKPKLGKHQVYIVVECMGGGLVAKEVNVKVKETKTSKTNGTDRKTSPIGETKGMVRSEYNIEEATIPYALYQTKFNALYQFITTCQQEATVINDQLVFARIALENLEKQTFEVKKCEEREKVEGKITKLIESKRTGDSVGSFEDVFSPEDHTDETYRTKFNSLQAFITACQQEITETHASREITAAIKDQLTFAKVALDNLKKQRSLHRI